VLFCCNYSTYLLPLNLLSRFLVDALEIGQAPTAHRAAVAHHFGIRSQAVHNQLFELELAHLPGHGSRQVVVVEIQRVQLFEFAEFGGDAAFELTE